MPRIRTTCPYCHIAFKASARCYHPGQNVPSRGSVLVGNPDGSGYSLVWYSHEWKSWGHGLYDAKGNQIGPGSRSDTEWSRSREEAVQDALDHLSAAITARLAARDTRRKTPTAAERFKADMERAGFTVEEYPDSDGTPLPSVECHTGHNPYEHLGHDHPDVQDVVRATTVRIRWTGMGGMLVALPAESR